MQRTMIAIGLVAIMAMVGLLMTPVTLMTVTGENGRAIVCERVGQDSSVALTFTHSMYGGDVTETYRPGNSGHLLRTSIVTANAAAAEYYAWDGAVARTGDGYEVMVPDQEFTAIPVIVDPIGNHRLTIDGKSWHLVGMVDGPAQVRLGLAMRPLATQVFGARC